MKRKVEIMHATLTSSKRRVAAPLLRAVIARPYVIHIPNCYNEQLLPLTASWKRTIPVTVAKTSSETEQWLSEHIPQYSRTSSTSSQILSSIGFDLEWKPSFTSNQHNKAALIQLATTEAILIIQIQNLPSIPQLLKELFMNRHILKVGVGVHDDLVRLHKDYHIPSRGFVDLACVAKELDRKIPRVGLSALYYEYFKVTVPKMKHVRMGNWEQKVLSESQIQYAAWDGLMAKQIYEYMLLKDSKFLSEEVADEALSKVVVGSRAEYKELLKATQKSDVFQDALAARLDARAARPVDDCKAAAGGTYRMLLDVIMTRLSWRFLKHTSAVSARRFRVEVVVEGRTLAAGEGDSKLSANESASEAVVRDLLAIERSLPLSRLWKAYAGNAPLNEAFYKYLHSRPLSQLKKEEADADEEEGEGSVSSS